MEIKNPYWYRHITLNDKQRKELEVYLKNQKPAENFSYLNNEFKVVNSFDDVKDVIPSIEEEYVFDNDVMIF